eukprot:130344-Pyramimonas_sp.AAC.1
MHSSPVYLVQWAHPERFPASVTLFNFKDAVCYDCMKSVDFVQQVRLDIINQRVLNIATHTITGSYSLRAISLSRLSRGLSPGLHMAG